MEQEAIVARTEVERREEISSSAHIVKSTDSQEQEELRSTLEFESGASEGGKARGTLHFCKEGANAASKIWCVVAVPGLMTAPDFCQFVLPYAGVLSKVRLLRRVGESNRYMAVLLFELEEDGRKFHQAYEGRLFLGGLIKERCRVRAVESIVFSQETAEAAVQDVGSPVEDTGRFPFKEMFLRTEQVEGGRNCPVCLERMGVEHGGIVTTLCHHVMHLTCLSKWDLNTCPVCRYRHELTPEVSLCMSCNSPDDVWMCLICANVACGRMNAQHAVKHFEETNHPFAVNLEDTVFWTGDKVKAGSVWDYISERFVNRLLSSEDGKVVEVTRRRDPQPAHCGGGLSDVEDDVEEVEDKQVQAAVYASRMDALVDEYKLKLESMESAHDLEMSGLSTRLESLEAGKIELDKEVESLRQSLAEAVKERKAFARKLNDSRKAQERSREKFDFLKKMYETLLRDKSAWRTQVESLEAALEKERAEKESLEEQLRDMMLHMEMQRRIEGSGGCGTEIKGGALLGVGPSPRERLSQRTRGR